MGTEGGPRTRLKKADSSTRRLSTMKKILTIALLLSIAPGVTALIHARTAAARPGLAALPQGAPLKTIQGTVKVDGEKVMFVADEDNQSCAVMNRDNLKPHPGHHVED